MFHFVLHTKKQTNFSGEKKSFSLSVLHEKKKKNLGKKTVFTQFHMFAQTEEKKFRNFFSQKLFLSLKKKNSDCFFSH